MNMIPFDGNFNGPVTMSSREIAELCEKQHKHVLRDIEAMLGQINEPNFGPVDFEGQYQDAKGEWRKEYRLPKDLTVTLITGYRADLRYKVVKRLEQLEVEKQSGGFQVPRSLGEALQLAADQARQIEAMQEDVAAHQRLAKADGSMCFRDSAKSMQVRPIDLTQYMATHRWIYRQAQNGPWLAYQDKIEAGYLEHKVMTVDRSDGTEKAVTQCRITPKGLSKLAKLIGGAS